MRGFLRMLAGITAIGLIIYGMSPLATEQRWIGCLWLATFLGGFAVWPQRQRRATGIFGGTQNLAMVLLIAFVMLTVQLLYLQVIKANNIYSRTETDQNGSIVSNVRPVLERMKVERGSIFDEQGNVLVENFVGEDNFSYRTYPVADTYNIEAFSHVVGFVSTVYGLSGIEDTYNGYLSGERGNSWQRIQNDVLNRPQAGNNIQLTINAELQQRAYTALGGRNGSIVVIDVKTGAIRALVSYPAFDPRLLTLETDKSNWGEQTQIIEDYWKTLLENPGRPLINRPIQGQYAPGSVFKTVTAIAALNSPDIAKPEDIRCPERFQGDPQVSDDYAVRNAVDNEEQYIKDLYGENYGLDAVYAFSCNTAFAQYGVLLESDGRDLLTEQARRFHIYEPDQAPDEGDLTDLPSYASYLYVNDDGYWPRIAAVQDTAYGQGRLLVTPLQMAQVTQSIGNNGIMMKPYLVERVTTNTGSEVYRARPQEIGTPMSPQVSVRIRQSMLAVIEKGWSGAAVAGVPGYKVGGKSGTAENGPQANPGIPHAWFISLAPLEAPQYAVVVMVENGGEGTSVGGSLAGQVMAATLEIKP